MKQCSYGILLEQWKDQNFLTDYIALVMKSAYSTVSNLLSARLIIPIQIGSVSFAATVRLLDIRFNCNSISLYKTA